VEIKWWATLSSAFPAAQSSLFTPPTTVDLSPSLLCRNGFYRPEDHFPSTTHCNPRKVVVRRFRRLNQRTHEATHPCTKQSSKAPFVVPSHWWLLAITGTWRLPTSTTVLPRTCLASHGNSPGTLGPPGDGRWIQTKNILFPSFADSLSQVFTFHSLRWGSRLAPWVGGIAYRCKF